MGDSNQKPNVFIAASSASNDYATAVQGHLEKDFNVTVWSDLRGDKAKLLPEFIAALPSKFDFGVFIFSDDDTLEKGNKKFSITRDNVLFEFGVFVGRHGYERCFILAPDLPDFHLPSDLDGFLFQQFVKPFDVNNVESAFRVPVAAIRKDIQRLWPAIREQRQREMVPERVAAICYRKNQEGLYEFLLVKSSGEDSDRRGFPKQPYRKNENRPAIEVAMEVAAKEGGVKVKIAEKAPKFLPFKYKKESDNNAEVNYTPYLFEVTAITELKAENKFRDPQFFAVGQVFTELRKNRNDAESKKLLELVICHTYEFLLTA